MKYGFEMANYLQNTIFKKPSKICRFWYIFWFLAIGYQAEKQLLPLVIQKKISWMKNYKQGKHLWCKFINKIYNIRFFSFGFPEISQEATY